MLGKDHLLLSVLTLTAITIPVMSLPNLGGIFLLIVMAVGIGSLAPDADSPDAAIFHTKIRGLKGNTKAIGQFIGPVLPIFGYTLKYLIYKPSVLLLRLLISKDKLSTRYEVKESHRGILHSILGMLIAFVFLNIYGLAIMIALPEVLTLKVIVIFTVAFSVGFLMHLIEDSCTVSGVNYGFPFNRRYLFKGSIRTGKYTRKTEYFTFYLGAATVGNFFAPSVLPNYGIVISTSELILIVSGVVLFGWMVFLKISKVKKIKR